LKLTFLRIQNALLLGCLCSVELTAIEWIELGTIADDHVRSVRIARSGIIDHHASNYTCDGIPGDVAFCLHTANAIRIIEVNGRKCISAAAIGQSEAVDATIRGGSGLGCCPTAGNCHRRLNIIHSRIGDVDGNHSLRRGHNCRGSCPCACASDNHTCGRVIAAGVGDGDAGNCSTRANLRSRSRSAAITGDGDSYIWISQSA